MGRLLERAENEGVSLPTAVDALTVQVAAVLWRMGGTASVSDMAGLLAITEGKSVGLTTAEQDFLESNIEFHVSARAAQGLAGVIERAGEDHWVLTDLARRILGPCPSFKNSSS